ncbi:hypothetical protein WOLCODRAFT_160705 [Wolfiporia cocos MD-104 SS10]|uniref:Mid2 domain-containing protein n=1 Tax=Wolfiporia cocos (strain MD-104) TaxID=742152 RepID=A0A2H3IW85_WOLCO|nr:hypothetical protein WOLCODRAFT_160705 [Wolfiporia cocos MD-104 SS10]
MRIAVLILAAGLYPIAICASLTKSNDIPHVSHISAHHYRRDLSGLFGGLDPASQSQEQETDSGTHDNDTPEQAPRPADEPSKTDSSTFNLFSPFATLGEPTKTKSAASSTGTKSESSITTDADVSATAEPTSTQESTSSTSSATVSATQAAEDRHSSDSSAAGSSSSNWKIVGVAVIAFSAVAAILVAAVFFDHWWGFLRDVVWKRREPEGMEEMIPDWEKASWEVRLGHDRHRYPSFTSGAPSRHNSAKTKARDWTQERRPSPCPGLTPAERMVLSPGYVPPAPPTNVYLNPNARPSTGNADTYPDQSTATLVNTPRTAAGYTSPGSNAHTGPCTGDRNPFSDRPVSPPPADAYGGIDGR